MDIKDIKRAVRKSKIRITDHADEEAQNDRLTFDEIFYSTKKGEIIKDYPDDKPYPSCLIFGKNPGGEPIHTVWAYNEDNKWAVLVTVYRPDPDKWIAFKERRK